MREVVLVFPTFFSATHN